MSEQKVKVFSQLYDKIENGKKVFFVRFGLKNASDKIILSPVYNTIGPFKNGQAIVLKDKKMGIVNQSGNFVLPLKYDKIENQSRTQASFFSKNNHVFELPDDGKITVFYDGKSERFNLREQQNQREFV